MSFRIMTTINALPDELVSCVFEAISEDEFADSTTFVPLTHISRRFYRLVLPYVYKTLDLFCSNITPYLHVSGPQITGLLHRSLANNPALRPLCRSLHVLIPSVPDHLLRVDIALDFLRWCTRLKELYISGLNQGDESLWPGFRRALAGQTGLEDLGLRACSAALIDMPWAVQMVDGFKNLHSLQIVPSKSAPEKFVRVSSHQPAPSGIAVLINRQEREATSPVKQLVLYQHEHSLAAFAALMRWPAQLNHLELSQFDVISDLDDDEWEKELQAILSTHRTTIHTLDLRDFGVLNSSEHFRPFHAIDLRPFSALTSLTLDYQITGTDPSLVPRLLAPQLCVFTWDLMIMNEGGFEEAVVSLEQPEEDWLCTLARAADEAETAQTTRATAKAPKLRLVEVMYEPLAEQILVCNQYPQDRLDRVQAELNRRGIEMFTFPLKMSKDVYMEEHFTIADLYTDEHDIGEFNIFDDLGLFPIASNESDQSDQSNQSGQ